MWWELLTDCGFNGYQAFSVLTGCVVAGQVGENKAWLAVGSTAFMWDAEGHSKFIVRQRCVLPTECRVLHPTTTFLT